MKRDSDSFPLRHPIRFMLDWRDDEILGIVQRAMGGEPIADFSHLRPKAGWSIPADTSYIPQLAFTSNRPLVVDDNVTDGKPRSHFRLLGLLQNFRKGRQSRNDLFTVSSGGERRY